MQVLYPEAKVILLGEFGVGKTSIFRRYSLGTFIDTSGMDWSQYREFTLGLDNYSKKFECVTDDNETRTIRLRLYDTGGLERIGSIGNSYYKSAEAALLVFARDNVDSFNCLTQHLLEVLSFANAKLYLVSNKVDIKNQEVSDEDIRAFMEQFPTIDDHFQVSCKTNQPSVDDMFQVLAQKIASSSINKLSRRLDSIKLTQSPNPGPDDGPTYEHQYEHNATDLYGTSSSCSNSCI